MWKKKWIPWHLYDWQLIELIIGLMVNWHSDKRLVPMFALIVSGLNKIAEVGDEIHQNSVNYTIWEFSIYCHSAQGFH